MPLQIIRQDITKIKVDAIVNPTNEEMIGYSGIDHMLHTLGGELLEEECRKAAPLPLGKAKLTGAYNIPAKYIIHTAGPLYKDGKSGESEILRSCYIESLSLAIDNGCETVALPLISSGEYGYPKDQVLKFAVRAITEFLFENELTVFLCVYDRDSYSFSSKLFSDIKEFINDEYVRERGEYLSRSISPNILYQRRCRSTPAFLKEEESRLGVDDKESLREYIKNIDKSFSEMLFDLIDKRGISDVECYKRANVDKRTFSKIKSNKNYRPSKQTVIAFAISLKLDTEETLALLKTVGFTLSGSCVFDRIICFFIKNKNYDIFEINEALFEFDQVLLGSF